MLKQIVSGTIAILGVALFTDKSYAVSCQAEDAYGLLGVNDDESGLSGYNGSGYINRRSFKEAGDYIEWKVNVASAGSYAIKFRYQAGGNKNLTFTINDVPQSTGSPDFVGVTSWTIANFGNYSLSQGENTIRLTVGPNGWVDMDEMQITGPSTPECIKPVRPSVSGQTVRDHMNNTLVWKGVNIGWFIDFQHDQQDAADLKNSGANFVRIVLPWYNDSWDTRSPGSPSNCYMTSSALSNLDGRISAFTNQGLWVALAPRSSYGAGDGTFAAGNGGEGNFWTNPALREEYISMYECLVERYKDTDYIAVWEGLSEPRVAASQKVAVRTFYEEVFDRLEAVDPRGTPFMMGPARFYDATQLTNEYHITDRTDVIYTVDHFAPHNYTHQTSGTVPLDLGVISTASGYLNQALSFRSSNNVPLHINQFGAKLIAPLHATYDGLLLTLFDNNNLSWSYWQWRNGAFAAIDDPQVRNLLENNW